jgi:hypothetical protein
VAFQPPAPAPAPESHCLDALISAVPAPTPAPAPPQSHCLDALMSLEPTAMDDENNRVRQPWQRLELCRAFEGVLPLASKHGQPPEYRLAFGELQLRGTFQVSGTDCCNSEAPSK